MAINLPQGWKIEGAWVVDETGQKVEIAVNITQAQIDTRVAETTGVGGGAPVTDTWLEQQLTKFWGAGLSAHQAGITADKQSDPQNWTNQDAALRWIKAHPWTEKFKGDLNQFREDFKDLKPKQTYDTKRWTDSAIEEEFRRQYSRRPGELQAITGNLISIIDQDFADKQDAGAIDLSGKATANYDKLVDTETGTLKPKEERDKLPEGAISDNEQFVRDFAKENGFELSDAGYKHFAKLLDDNKADRFQIETLMRGTKEATDAEFEQLYKEFEPKITEAEIRELSILDDEAERTRKAAGEEFKRIAPTLGRIAKQLGGRTREDTFVTDALARELADIERTRGDFLEQQRIFVRFGQEKRRQLLETGQFEELKAGALDDQINAVTMATNLVKEQQRMQDKLSSLSSQKSLLLAQRAMDRHAKDIAKQQDRLRRQTVESINRANRKARKLSGIVAPIIGAIGAGAAAFTGGASLGLTALAAGIGGGTAFAQQSLTAQGVSTPQLNFSSIGSAFTPNRQFIYDPYTGRRI